MGYRTTRRAESDLKDIYRYTFKQFGELQADKYLLELDGVFQLLSEQPRMGRIYDGRTFQFVHGRHIILYRIMSDHVLVGRIFHGSQRRGPE